MARRGLRPATAGGHRLWASRGWLASPAADRSRWSPARPRSPILRAGSASSVALPGCDVPGPLARGLIPGAGLSGDGLALGLAAFQPGPGPFGTAAGFLLGHPSGERD